MEGVRKEKRTKRRKARDGGRKAYIKVRGGWRGRRAEGEKGGRGEKGGGGEGGRGSKKRQYICGPIMCTNVRHKYVYMC